MARHGHTARKEEAELSLFQSSSSLGDAHVRSPTEPGPEGEGQG